MADTDSQVEVYSPDGRYGIIPSSQVDDAKAQNYRLKDDYVEAVHPQTGKTGIIPKDQWDDAQKQGYVMSPWEQQRAKAKAGAALQPVSEGPTPSSIVPAQGGGANLMQAPNPSMEQFQQGQEAGSKRAAMDIGTSAIGAGVSAGLSKILAPSILTKTIGTGILSPEGREVTRDVATAGPSIAQRGAGKVVQGTQIAVNWMKENPIKAYAVARMAEELGIDPMKLAGKVIKYGKGLL
jgi:hypothetical protein